jgi:CheY-like chemotaxis protein
MPEEAMSSVNILIVDDDHEASHRLADVLAATGHLTRVAGNGFEGLREVASDPPDIILLDVEMPILDGIEMAEALAIRRAGKPSIPIVLISATRDLERIARLVGTTYYLRKPFGISQVISLVNEALDAGPR